MKKIIFASLLLFSPLFAEQPAVFPSTLQKGDLIALVFPASFLDKDDSEADAIMKRKAEWLEEKGYRTRFFPAKVNRFGYLAGTDLERAEALMDAWTNEEVKAIWCFRGGYGTQRILDYLEYETIKARPKIFIGMSDITALHQAIQQKTGLVTFLAPVLNFFDNNDGEFDDSYAFSSFEEILVNQRSGEIPLPPGQEIEVISAGKAEGKLVGGNLCLVSALCGTKWQLNTEGKVLILEEVSESIYRIDRELWQLKESGLLDKPAAVILGTWKDCNPNGNYSLTLEQVFNYYFGEAPYPVIRGFPTGHGKYQTTLPLNAMVEIDTEAKSVKILESAYNTVD
jgi:muramoyltetrapeptide carboxypeptidase